MRTISKADYSRDAQRFEELLFELGRLRSLRDPLHSSSQQQIFTHAQVHALMWLKVDGSMAMTDLARRSNSSLKTMTGVIDRLQRDGLVRRVRDENDRRSFQVELTPTGKTACEQMHKEVRCRLENLMSLLDKDDRKALLRIAAKVIARMKERMTDFFPGTGT